MFNEYTVIIVMNAIIFLFFVVFDDEITIIDFLIVSGIFILFFGIIHLLQKIKNKNKGTRLTNLLIE